MTVAELMAELSKHSLEMEIKVTWEGQVIEITPDNLYQSLDGVLLIDADDNTYKDDFETGELGGLS